ncbi:MAG: DNA-directed RNA polymerase subunit P [archaeon]
MVEYKCGSCKHIVKEPRDASGTLRCVKCGYKIMFKARQPVGTHVKAI